MVGIAFPEIENISKNKLSSCMRIVECGRFFGRETLLWKTERELSTSGALYEIYTDLSKAYH